MIFKAVVDYTRRCDPACPAGVTLLRQCLDKYGYPSVFHFWTKAPATVAKLYEDLIKEMRDNGSCVTAQVTLNYYGKPLEYIAPERMDLAPLTDLLGGDHVHLRYDPIILGTFKMELYEKCVKAAVDNGVNRITVNFLVPKYEKVDEILTKFGVPFHEGTEEEKRGVLRDLRAVTPDHVEISTCAECSTLLEKGIINAGCADKKWFLSLGADLTSVKGHSSRKGCRCFYTCDWGVYPTAGGYICPHKCLYCYSKHNIFAWDKIKKEEIDLMEDIL